VPDHRGFIAFAGWLNGSGRSIAIRSSRGLDFEDGDLGGLMLFERLLLRLGDALVITRVDRLARSMKDLQDIHG
jgi:hypothetical protein